MPRQCSSQNHWRHNQAFHTVFTWSTVLISLHTASSYRDLVPYLRSSTRVVVDDELYSATSGAFVEDNYLVSHILLWKLSGCGVNCPPQTTTTSFLRTFVLVFSFRLEPFRALRLPLLLMYATFRKLQQQFWPCMLGGDVKSHLQGSAAADGGDRVKEDRLEPAQNRSNPPKATSNII